ncbi:MAG: transcription antitermination factor NusB [Clostridia bacterium]|nr:transcription antitermination factor NusB [Clostridia bacterium]
MPLNRRKEREIVFQMLFAAQFDPEADTQTLFETLADEMEEEGIRESAYVREVFCGAREYIPTAMEKIRQNAQGWRTERFSKATLAILQLALYEMDCVDSVPTKIAINEAVELSKRFDEEGSRKFVNGILGALAGE